MRYRFAMNARAPRILHQSALVSALPALGIAGVGTLGVDAALLGAGGLAPLVVAAAVALAVGAPVAAAERAQPAPGEIPAVLGRVVLTGLAALAAAHVAQLDGWVYGLISIVAWPVLWLGAHRWGGLAASVLFAAALATAALAAGAALIGGSPWTLLLPGWTEWREWLPWSLFAGLIAGGAAVGHWPRQPRLPGRPWVPWSVAGLAVLAWVLIALRRAAVFGAAQGSSADPWADLSVALFGLAVVAVAVGGGRESVGRDAGGLGATIVLGWWAPGAAVVWWHTGVPIAMASLLAGAAVGSSGGHRWGLAGAAAVALSAAALGWPGLPDSMAASAAAAGLLVIGFWVVATRAALRSDR
ncbi:MAG: hypothetical protein ACI8PZ_004854 [Myxococcota bacterium]|jgi:hypothetical protein